MKERPVCRECACTLPGGAGARGYCPECHTTEAPELPAAQREDLEARARASCSAAGLALHRFPCALSEASPEWPEGRCGPCWRERNARARAQPVTTTMRPNARPAEFTDIDAEQLRRYFSKPRSTGIGSMGGFGAMIERIGESTNHDSPERPSRTEPRCPACGDPLTLHHRHARKVSVDFAKRPLRVVERELGAGVFRTVRVYAPTIDPDTTAGELLDTNPTHGVGHVGSWDDQAVDLTQDGRFRQRVRDVLSRISAKAFEVLEARYSGQDAVASRGTLDPRIGELAPVAILTGTLASYRAAEAEDGRSAGGRDLLAVLTKSAAGGTSKEVRTSADETLRAIRVESLKLVQWAEGEYALAAAGRR